MSSSVISTVQNEKDNYVIEYVDYTDESMLSDIQRLVAADLSEPYSVFTYRYFLHTWPNLCICVYARSISSTTSVTSEEVKDESISNSGNHSSTVSDRVMIGTIVCKAEVERDDDVMVGYIAMLAVNQQYRKRGIGQKLISTVIERMVNMGCEEITLEAEATNKSALSLYERLGFSKDDKMTRYYLNGGDAYRLKFWVDVNKDETITTDDDNDINNNNDQDAFVAEIQQQSSSSETQKNGNETVAVGIVTKESKATIDSHSTIVEDLRKLEVGDFKPKHKT